MKLTLNVLKLKLAIVKFGNSEPIPKWISFTNDFLSITKTTEELSIVCEQTIVPDNIENCVRNWKAFKVEGPLDFSLTGILASLAQPLAGNKISIFAISTYDTDYILVKESDLDKAIQVLKKDFKILC